MGSTVSSTSALRRKRLEAELALQRRKAELTAQIVEQQRALATAEHELRQAELDEEEEEILLRSGDEAYSHEDLHTESRSSLPPSTYSFAAGDHSKTAPFLVNARRGAARLLRFGINGPIYVARPRNDASSWLLVGADMVCSARYFPRIRTNAYCAANDAVELDFGLTDLTLVWVQLQPVLATAREKSSQVLIVFLLSRSEDHNVAGNGNDSRKAFNELVDPGLEDILGHLQSERHSLESVTAVWRV